MLYQQTKIKMPQLIKEEEFKNKKFLIAAGAGLVLFFILVSLFIFKNENNDHFYDNVKVKNVGVDNEASLRVALEERIKSLEEKLKKLYDEITSKLQVDDGNSTRISELESELLELRKAKEVASETKKSANKDPEVFEVRDATQNGSTEVFNQEPSINPNALAPRGIDAISFEAESSAPVKNEYSTEEYLPAGSYASAKLLSSVDAGIGLTTQSQPRPVLLRATSHAFSSSEKENKNTKEKTDIRGCTIVGEAQGDLSSERGYIRLLNMTCTSSAGKITETDVQGFVASYGKAGIRGNVIERNGDKAAKAFMSGLFAGLGRGIQQRFQPATSIMGSAATIEQSNANVIATGLGSGAGAALDRLSQYYIQRMEQIQPVISIPQGLDIEVIFIKGTFVDGRSKAAATTPNSQTAATSNSQVK